MGGNRVRGQQKIGYVSLMSSTMWSCVFLGSTTTQHRSVRREIEKIARIVCCTCQAIEKNKE
jgi:hypothetical protein